MDIDETLVAIETGQVSGLIIYYAKEQRELVNRAIDLCLAIPVPVVIMHLGWSSDVPDDYAEYGVDSNFRDGDTWIADVRRRLNLPELPSG